MNQNRLLDLAQKLIRLSTISESHANKLSLALEKWFLGEFVKGMKFATLKKIYTSGTYEIFADLLSAQSDANRIAVLEKVDKYHPQLRTLSKKQTLDHLEQLAKGSIKPTPKPKTASKSSRSSAPSRPARGLIASSKY